MGGYNIFCEILSFDKPTLLVPRVVPRREQAIRAAKAEAAGLVTCLPIDGLSERRTDGRRARRAAGACAALRRRASTQLLVGLDTINARTETIMLQRTRRRQSVSRLSVVR